MSVASSALGAARLVVVISSADMTATRPAGRAVAIGANSDGRSQIGGRIPTEHFFPLRIFLTRNRTCVNRQTIQPFAAQSFWIESAKAPVILLKERRWRAYTYNE